MSTGCSDFKSVKVHKTSLFCQYFSPYLSVDLHRMAAAFNTSVSSLEDELTQLILNGQISARIDSHAKVSFLVSNDLNSKSPFQIMYARNVDQRSAVFQKVLEFGEAYQLRTKVMECVQDFFFVPKGGLMGLGVM